MKHIVVPFEIKSAGESTGEFEGYGSTFGNVDYGMDVCVAGCFTKSIAKYKKDGLMPSMFFGHDSNEPIGDYLQMEEDKKGLFLAGKLWVGDNSVPKAVQAHRMMLGTGRKGLSIGYVTKKKSLTKEGVRMLEELDLLEVSVVPFAMNPKAGVTRAKGLRDVDGQPLDPRTVESMLRDELGLSAREAKAFMSEGYKALSIERDADESCELEELHKSLSLLITNIQA
jgi:HK97 family phage prohead protease